jgi:hypothetical protein
MVWGSCPTTVTDHPGGFLGVVAGLAETLTVAAAGRPVVGHRLRMVGVPDGCVTPRRSTDLVPKPDEPGQATLEAPTAGVHRDQLTVPGAAVEAAEPGQAALAGSLGQLAGQLGGDRAVAVEVRRVVARAEKDLVADHELHLDRNDAAAPAQQTVDERVRHDLVAAARVTLGSGRVRGVRQRLENGHAGGDRQLRSESRHRVGDRAQRHSPFGLGDPAPEHAGSRVELGRQAARRALELVVAPLLQPLGIAGESTVDRLSVLEGQAGGLPGQDGRLPLGDVSRPQSPTRARHLVDQDPGEPDVLPATVVGLPPGEGDLGSDALALPVLRGAPRGLVAPYRCLQVGGDLDLEAVRRAHKPLESAQHGDASIVVVRPLAGCQLSDPCQHRRRIQRGCVDCRHDIEHVFDHTGMGLRWQELIHMARGLDRLDRRAGPGLDRLDRRAALVSTGSTDERPWSRQDRPAPCVTVGR